VLAIWMIVVFWTIGSLGVADAAAAAAEATVAATAADPAPTDSVFTLYHDAVTRTVREARISPDGSLTAYVLEVPRDPYADGDGPAWRELHVVGPEPNRQRGFVTGEVSVSRIAWTPDGHGIAFLAKRRDDDETALYVIPVDGGEARRIVGYETAVKEYAFRPDGRQVAFLAEEPLDAAEQKRRSVLKQKGFDAEAYEEDLRYVRVHLVDVAGAGDGGGGSSRRDSLAAEPRILELEGSASELHWSPDGRKLAVAIAPTPLIDDYYMRRDLHIVDPASGATTARIELPGKLGRVVWSPDSKRLALLAAADLHDPGEGRLMIAPATGGEPRDLMPGWQGDAMSIDFAGPDRIVFVAHEGVACFLAEIDADGGDRRRLSDLRGPALRTVSVSAGGGAAAVIADAPTHPAEVFRWERDGNLTRSTDSNPWLGGLRIAPQEIVRYQARDGTAIEGLLIRPLDAVRGKRYPLILFVHGGPESHFSNGWLTRYVSPGQAAAARGFACFYPNYRGSTGRGVAFSKLDQGDYAGAEFNDLVDGVNHLVRTGLVDEDRVGITGGSYGGYAAAWGATALSEHFAASVMFAGISENIAKFGTTDIPNEMYLVHARTWPWENWQFFLDTSPVYHAQEHHTPLLIVHGKEDTRVHPSQSLILYRYLETLDQAPVRLVMYPGEKHGNRKTAARLDYAMRLMRWMEHYLTGPGGEPPPWELDYDPEGCANEIVEGQMGGGNQQ
jgi:dipeptidyl aminopeptidase/acylaminoacyl peptidase